MAGLAGAVLTTFAVAPAANAVVAVEPVGPAWTPDGAVNATVTAGDRVYIGGTFTGGVAALNAADGSLVWLGKANGDVRALALSSDGTHLLAGGAFTAVGDQTDRKLASLRVADGTSEPGFKAAASGTVRDIVVVGSRAYFGGMFTSHAGMAQVGLGAVEVSTGANVTSFTTSANGHVYGLATDGTKLFIAGRFTAVNGQPRRQLAAVTLSTQSLSGWAPAASCDQSSKTCNLNWDVTVGNGTVYAVGRNAGAVYAVDAVTGSKKWTKGVNPYGAVVTNGDGQAVTLGPDGLLYVGGHFTTITTAGSAPRQLLAAFDPASGALQAFKTRFVDMYPGIWALDASSTRLYAGGSFIAAGSKVTGSNKYPYFAVFQNVG